MKVRWNRADSDERPIPLRSYWLALPNATVALGRSTYQPTQR